MKVILLVIAWLGTLLADVYYAKMEPVEHYSVQAAAAGKVVFADADLEGQRLENSALLVQIDDALDKKRLKNSRETLVLTRARLKDLEEIVKIRQSNYDRIKQLKTKSSNEKDAELILLISAKTQANQTQEQVLSLQIQIDELEDTIAKKHIEAKSVYLEKLYVREGDYVGAGTELYDAYDISHAKLVAYLNRDDREHLSEHRVLFDGEEREYTIARQDQVADSQNISSYRVDFLLPAPQMFSQLVKIELKKKDK